MKSIKISVRNQHTSQEEDQGPGLPELPRFPGLLRSSGLSGLPGYLEMANTEVPSLTDSDNSESESEDESRLPT